MPQPAKPVRLPMHRVKMTCVVLALPKLCLVVASCIDKNSEPTKGSPQRGKKMLICAWPTMLTSHGSGEGNRRALHTATFQIIR